MAKEYIAPSFCLEARRGRDNTDLTDDEVIRMLKATQLWPKVCMSICKIDRITFSVIKAGMHIS